MRKFSTLFLFLVIYSTTNAQEYAETINLKNQEDITRVRDSIKNYIWRHGVADSTSVIDFEQNIDPFDALGPENSSWLYEAQSVDKFSVHLKNDLVSHIQVLHPAYSNGLNIPIIYHGGHDGAFSEDRYLNVFGSVFKFFLERGFDVVVIDMPLKVENYKFYVLEKLNRTIYVDNHDDIFQLREPFYYFLEPIRKTVDFLETRYKYKNFAMIGLSGGGWATTLYSAIDPRIKQSFEVAGSIPMPERSTNPSDWGDSEQNFAGFYDQFNYSTLYTLASSGKDRLHYQILNKKDNCCFAYDGSRWTGNVKETLNNIKDPGNYKFFFDTVAKWHMISNVALDTIYYHITNDLLIKNLPGDLKISIANVNRTKVVYLCDRDSLALRNLRHEDEVQWYRDSVPLDNETNGTLRINTPGKYYAKNYNISGIELFSDTVIAENFPRAEITRQGNILVSNSRATGNKWYYNGFLMSGFTGNSIYAINPGSYTVVASFGNCVSDASLPYDIGVVAYPVPATTEINIRLDEALGKVRVEMYDMTGTKILTSSFTRYTKIILPGNIKKGVHVLKISNDAGFVEIKKIVIQ